MDYQFSQLTAEHAAGAVGVFNYYVKNGHAAFFEESMPEAAFERLLATVGDYPRVAAFAADGALAGFGFLKPYHPAPALRKTAEVTYFIAPEHTRHGLGGELLERLGVAGKAQGITNLVASVSSLNEDSLSFHRRYGFLECGVIRCAGVKFGKDFDLVLFQRAIV